MAHSVIGHCITDMAIARIATPALRPVRAARTLTK
jgi:hypothetical protein